MSERFTDLPAKLRRAEERLCLAGEIDFSEMMWITATMTDAALMIEALEQEVAHRPKLRKASALGSK